MNCIYCGRGDAQYRCQPCKGMGQEVPYCSNDCQQRDWRLAHKHFCSLPIPDKKDANKVYGFLLSVNESKPRVVEVARYGGREFTGPDCAMGLNYMTANPTKDQGGQRRMKDTLLFVHRDTFLIDGSPINQCVATLAGGQAPHPWAGPVIVLKYEGTVEVY